MRHTKGPWAVKLHSKVIVRQEGMKRVLNIDEYYDNTIGPLHIVDGDDFLIAAVAARDADVTSEQSANALLITRAPDLLEKASKLVGALRYESTNVQPALLELEAVLEQIKVY